MSHKVILDTDPGIDDAMALFTALAHPAIDLIGVTTTFGNVAVQQATRNALTLLEMAQASHIPVAQGGASPWILSTPPFLILCMALMVLAICIYQPLKLKRLPSLHPPLS